MASVKQAWIKKYGVDKGLQLWENRKKQSACTLESFIKKYGDVDGINRYNKWKTNLSKSRTLIGYIEKFGQEDGKKRYFEKNKKLSVSVNALTLSGKSESEIYRIRKQHSNSSKITLDTLIEKYGLDLGTKKWQTRISKAKISSKRSIEYWLKLHGGNLESAKKSLADYQRRDKKFYIQKYGEIVGYEKYNEAKKNRFLGGFIAPVSKFQKEIEEFVKTIYEGNVFGHENNYCFFVNGELEQSVVIPDILIEDKKLIIECYGDYWHCSDKYSESYFHEVIKKTAKEIRHLDERRVDFLKNKGYVVLIIWENDWIVNRQNQTERILYEINKERN